MLRTTLGMTVAALMLAGCSQSGSGTDASVVPEGVAVARDVFYKKQTVAGGLVIRASEKVPDAALAKARETLLALGSAKPELLAGLSRAGVVVTIVGIGENVTDLPGMTGLRPRQYHDIFRRNAGATPAIPFLTVGEENLTGRRGDRGAGEVLLAKSFATSVSDVLLAADSSFRAGLDGAYENFLTARAPGDPIFPPERGDYWAEGVQAWFDAGRTLDRAGLKRSDPALAALVARVFGENETRIRPVATDKDPASPEFVTPPEFLAWETRFKRGEETLAPPRATILPLLPPWLSRSLRPEYLAEWKSPATPGAPGRLYFVNTSDAAVRLEIVDASGNALPQGRLFPGRHTEPETAAGTVWRILDDRTRRVVGYTVAVAGDARRVIENSEDAADDLAAEGELESETPTALALLPPAERTVWASSEPSHETTVFLRNDGPVEIRLESADRAGELTPLGRLRPGDYVTYDTFRDQVWRVTLADGTLLGYVVASSGPGIASLNGKPAPGR